MKRQQKDTKHVRELKESWDALRKKWGCNTNQRRTARNVREPLTNTGPMGR